MNKKSRVKSAVDRLFLDKDGHVAVWQIPNVPIIGWLVFKLTSLLIADGALQDGLNMLSSAFLFTWAYLEISSGASLFRRLLGGVALAGVVVGMFKK